MPRNTARIVAIRNTTIDADIKTTPGLVSRSLRSHPTDTFRGAAMKGHSIWIAIAWSISPAITLSAETDSTKLPEPISVVVRGFWSGGLPRHEFAPGRYRGDGMGVSLDVSRHYIDCARLEAHVFERPSLTNRPDVRVFALTAELRHLLITDLALHKVHWFVTPWIGLGGGMARSFSEGTEIFEDEARQEMMLKWSTGIDFWVSPRASFYAAYENRSSFKTLWPFDHHLASETALRLGVATMLRDVGRSR